MPRLLPRVPFFKLLAVAQTALLARRHYQRLNARERRRLRELVRRGHRMNRRERNELVRLLGGPYRRRRTALWGGTPAAALGPLTVEAQEAL